MSSRTRLLVALASTGLIGYVAVGSFLGRVFGDTSYGQLAIFNEVVRLVLDAYVEPVNLDRAMAGARLGMADALDGDSAFLDAAQLRQYQEPSKDDDADVGLVLTRRFAFLIVVAARPGSPAEKAGLRTGDLIKSIDGRHTRPIPTVVGERMLRGAPGSTVKLEVMRLRGGPDPFEVSLVRERILPTSPSGRMLEGGTGYLRVTDVTPGTGDELRTQIDVLERAGATRMVLDLRDAAWGDPADAVGVAEPFLEGGPVAKRVGRSLPEQMLEANPSHTAWTGPLAVLVDAGTAGPAEVAAAALLDAGKARVVGEHTFGRAGISRAVALPEGGLVLTVGKFMSPNGASIHGEGIEPSVAVASREADEDAEEGAEAPPGDPILDKALEILAASDAHPAAA
jgi:carboxyl-terminal processing protease